MTLRWQQKSYQTFFEVYIYKDDFWVVSASKEPYQAVTEGNQQNDKIWAIQYWMALKWPLRSFQKSQPYILINYTSQHI